MGVDRESIPSVVARVRPVPADAPIVGIHFIKETAVFVLGEEALLMAAPDGEPERIAVHGGAILSSASDGGRVVTGGDDGKVVATYAKGNSETVATDAKRRWIDHVAVGPSNAVAWSAGKQAFAHAGKGTEKSLEVDLDGRRAGVRTEGVAARDRALQRRDALVCQCQGRARDAGMEGLASRRAGSARTAASS